MTTCTAVRDSLPAFAAGEPDEVGAGAHLEACSACRAEHQALVRELGRIRGGLATLDTGSASRERGRTALPPQREAPHRTRVLSWWTVGVGVAALVVGGFLVGQALHDSREPDPRSPLAPGEEPTQRFTDVSAIVARGDAPRVVQVRIEANGETRLRWRVSTPEATWTERGPWTLKEADARATWREATAGLRKTLEEACPERLTGSAVNSEKAPRLVIDVDAQVPWRLVQFVLDAASSAPHSLSRMTYLYGGVAAPLDQDLPADLGSTGAMPPQEFADLRLLRKESTTEPGRLSTWMRLFETQTWTIQEPVAGLPAAQAAARRASEEAVVFQALADAISAAIKRDAPAKPVVVLIKTPPPTGGRVPAGDVLRAAATLHSAGVDSIWFEGPSELPARGPR